MSKVNQIPLSLTDCEIESPEYDLSRLTLVRGKHAHRVGKAYSVTINHGDGTSTFQRFDGQGTLVETRKISSMDRESLENQENTNNTNESVPHGSENYPDGQ
jgi:hypothetical protein